MVKEPSIYRVGGATEGRKARKRCKLVCWGRVREMSSCYVWVEHPGQRLANGNDRMRQGIWVEQTGQSKQRAVMQ